MLSMDADQGVLRLAGRLHPGERIEILPVDQQFAAGLDRDEAEGLDGGLRRLDAKAREPLEVGRARGRGPLEEASRQFDVTLLG